MVIERKRLKTTLKCLLWGIAGGRCEFKGCNKPLYVHDVTGDIENLAENAHIHAVSPGGARYLKLNDKDKDSITNLMLVCPACHTVFDRNPDRYTAEVLFSMKKEHENRIRTLTSIDASMKSHLVYYTANIADDRLTVNDSDAKLALTSIGRYPAEMRPIDLSIHGSYTNDRDEKYYTENMQNLQKAIKGQVLDVIEQGESIALFAMAPQPLLICLGSQLNDKYNISVFQCHRRDNDKWSWKDKYSPIDFRVILPKRKNNAGKIALVLALSNSVIEDRIINVLGTDTKIYTITLKNPNRTFVTHPMIMDSFVKKSRELIEYIKQIHGNKASIHVFPVMPVSLAVRFGMDYMAKTDNPLIIYDEIAEHGFIPALKIGGKCDS